jgi:hypothetical protein
MSYLELASKTLKEWREANPTLIRGPQESATSYERNEINEKSPPPSHPVAVAAVADPLVWRGTLADDAATAAAHDAAADAADDTEEAQGRYWFPPPGLALYFQDESGRPCAAAEAHIWTWAGASSWFKVSFYPTPRVAMD